MATVNRDLRELKRVFDALKSAGHLQYKSHLRYVHQLLESTPRFRALLDVLAARTSDFDAEKWMRERVLPAGHRHEWPAREAEKIRVLHRLLAFTATADDQVCHPVGIGRLFVYGNDLDHAAQAVTEHVVVPLLSYLQDHLSEQSEILHRLERVRRQVEWFDQEGLYQQYLADPSRGEDLYDRRVREFLFAEGIDYPFSKPRSASGEADLVAGVETDDPLVCEIKLYDAEKYTVAYLKKGVGQAIRYAHDYGKPTAHLVIFNLSRERLQLPSDEPGSVRPPRLVIQGVTVFLIMVEAKPLPSASEEKGRKVRSVREVEREALVPTADDE